MSTKQAPALVLAVFSIVAASGCGGGGGSARTPAAIPGASTPNTAPAASGSAVSLAITITSGSSTSSSARKRPEYYPPAAASAVLTVQWPGGTTTSTTLACGTSCTGTMQVPIGTDTIAASIYSQANGAGTVLAQGSTSVDVQLGHTNTLALVLGGIVSTLAVAVPAPIALGTAATVGVSVTAKDPSGNTIIGTYASPVSLSITDPTHSTSLSTTSIAASGSTIDLAYNGSTSFTGSTITASASGAPSATALVQPIATITSHETPVWADAFVDSIGVNTHLSYNPSAYWSGYTTMKALMLGAGIRHVRDGPVEVTNPACSCNPLADLGAAGIKADVLLSYLSNENAAYVKTFLQQVPTAEAFEGPNEVNTNGDSNWIADTQAYTQTLYPAIKAINPALTVVSPSIAWINGSQNTYALLGNLSASLDFGNVHDYPGGNNPGTLGSGPSFTTGSGATVTYGSIAASVWADSAMAGTKPPWATETGYGDASGQTPQNINARYEPRLFLEEWLNGVARTYQYQFVDYGTDGFGNFGLVTTALTPKPDYYALKNLIGLLADPGSAVTPAPVAYAIGGGTSAVQHLLMQKRDGSLYLAIWIEASGFNVSTQAPIAVPSQNVTLNFGIPIDNATSYTFNDDGSMTPATLGASPVIPLTVTDHLTIIGLNETGSSATARNRKRP